MPELLSFVETTVFTKRISTLGLEDSLRHKSTIYLLYVYGKNEASTLSADEKKQLREIATQIKRQP